ncbi:MAG: phytoene/squalene synthase family protein [Phycisphaerae bacterium]
MTQFAATRTRTPATLAAKQAQHFSAARDICRRHAKSFYFASFFLPKPKRQASYAVYGFCRLLDDAIDDGTDPAEQIDHFAATLDRVFAGTYTPDDTEPGQAMAAFASTVETYGLKKRHFEELIAGCRMDLTISRYADWPQLEGYCYHVAGVVGLMMSGVFGLADDTARGRAVAMGNAMQLTNILRDVKEDWDRGRCYLPADEMARFGVHEADLAAGHVTEGFRAMMTHQIARARALFTEGAAGLPALTDDGSRYCSAVMAAAYSGILSAIERNQFDVFNHRAHLGTAQKVARLPLARRMARGETGW